MTNNVFSFINKKSNDKKFLLITLSNIIAVYNNTLYKYTKSYAGRLAIPKTETADIPKEFLSVQEYINSKKYWKTILTFINATEPQFDIKNYIDTMIRNWNEITSMINNSALKHPTVNIIFSIKMVKTYKMFKDKEVSSALLNKMLNIKHGEDFYRLTPSLQSNVNSLFNLKNINPDMTYIEIINVFNGEFEKEFKDVINDLEEEEITPEKLALYFK